MAGVLRRGRGGEDGESAGRGRGGEGRGTRADGTGRTARTPLLAAWASATAVWMGWVADGLGRSAGWFGGGRPRAHRIAASW